LLFVGIPLAIFTAGFESIFDPGAPNPMLVVGTVGDLVITPEDLRREVQGELQRRAQRGLAATEEDLLMDGGFTEVRRHLIRHKLSQLQMAKVNMSFNQEYLADRLKQDPSLQSADGTFDHERWNAWVEDERTNWNTIYDSVAESARQMVYGRRILSGARVLESDLREQFESENTSITLKYMLLDPPAFPTEEEIRAEYDTNLKTKYQNPEERRAKYVRFSLLPEEPALAAEIVGRARSGEDFAALATAHSEGPTKGSGGDIDWVTLSDAMRPPRDSLKGLVVGQVSDVIQYGQGYYIFKVDEERMAEDGVTREVKARQILFSPQITADDRAAIEARAEAFAVVATAQSDVATAAAAEGLEVIESPWFSTASSAIDGIPSADLGQFRSGLSTVAIDAVSPVAKGSNNLYVGQILETKPATDKSFEEVKEQATSAAEQVLKRGVVYEAHLQDLSNQIKDLALPLAEVPAQFGDLATASVETMAPFTASTYDYSSGVFWQPQTVYSQVADAAPGDVIGPIADMLGRSYMVELVEMAPPTQADWDDKWPTARDRLHIAALSLAQNQRYEDYLQDMEERILPSGAISWAFDDEIALQVLGLVTPDGAATTPPATTLPATIAPDPHAGHNHN
jgi:parvulin-like peptidyl-prolyl isomerase